MEVLNKLLKLFIVTAIVFAGIQSVQAHPAPSTIVTLTIQQNGSINADAVIPFVEINAAIGRNIEDFTLSDDVKEYLQNHFRLLSEDKVLQGSLINTSVEDDHLSAYWNFVAPSNKTTEKITVDYSVVIEKVVTHDALVYVKDQSGNSYQAGVLQYDFQTNALPTLVINLNQPHASGFLSSIKLGSDHFKNGYDHILFLITLLLVAPFYAINKKWERSNNFKKTVLHVVFLSLAFTIGHPLSLLLGSFLNIEPIAPFIEVLIAVTIALSALHGMKPIFGKAELVIVPVFGLIHGLAFSSELFSADVQLKERLLTTLAFNIGLEMFQIIVLVVALPLYLLILRFDRRNISRIALSSFAIVCAVYWFGIRLVELF